MSLPADTAAQLSGYIHRTAQAWVAQWITQRRAQLARRGIQASGSLSASMAYTLRQQVSESVSNQLEVFFDEHGRYVDMKRLGTAAGGDSLVEDLMRWIERKGLYERFVGRYQRQRGLRGAGDRQSVLRNMAWGIVKARQLRVRKRPWYNKSKSAALSDLYNQIAAGLPDLILAELKKNLTDGR